MTQFILGLLSSLAATFIAYISRFFWAPAINWLFLSVYPNISGNYRFVLSGDILPEILDELEIDDPDVIDLRAVPFSDLAVRREITIKQLANRVKGTITTFDDDGKIYSKQKVTGKVTPSRMVVLTFEADGKNHHDYGSSLSRISNSGDMLLGHTLFLCDCCEKCSSLSSLMKKI